MPVKCQLNRRKTLGILAWAGLQILTAGKEGMQRIGKEQLSTLHFSTNPASASVGILNFRLSILCCMTSATDLSLPIPPIPIPCNVAPGPEAKSPYRRCKGYQGTETPKVPRSKKPSILLAQVRRNGVRI